MSEFEKLVHQLDDSALAELSHAAARERGQRLEHAALTLEEIHPNMPAEAKARALDRIVRVLRGEE